MVIKLNERTQVKKKKISEMSLIAYVKLPKIPLLFRM